MNQDQGTTSQFSTRLCVKYIKNENKFLHFLRIKKRYSEVEEKTLVFCTPRDHHIGSSDLFLTSNQHIHI